MNAVYTCAFAALGLSLVPALAVSQTASTNFDVRITIVEECEINSAETLDFGQTGVLSAALDEEAEISITCTNTTPYQVGLNQGLGVGATTSARLMSIASGATVAYQLFSDSGRSSNWGNAALSDTVAGIGTGSAQSLTVYGRVPAQVSPAPGSYTDTITVSVTY